MKTGDILLCDLNPTIGREQGGRRPVVVVSARRYAVIPGLFLAIPLTSVDRGLQHHVTVTADQTSGLAQTSYAMTEQIRVLSHQRIDRHLGVVSVMALSEISRYAHMFVA